MGYYETLKTRPPKPKGNIHVPPEIKVYVKQQAMMVGIDGKRLKRNYEIADETYKFFTAEGYPPEVIPSQQTIEGWLRKHDKEIVELEETILKDYINERQEMISKACLRLDHMIDHYISRWDKYISTLKGKDEPLTELEFLKIVRELLDSKIRFLNIGNNTPEAQATVYNFNVKKKED